RSWRLGGFLWLRLTKCQKRGIIPLPNKRLFQWRLMALDRKEQIYSTARSLFSERGYHATTVRDIARELNMQGGSLYAHIESKEDVLWELVNRAADQFLGAVEPIVQSDLAPAEKLREMVRAHVRVVADNLGDATVFLHEWKFLGEGRRAEMAERRDRYE